MSIQSLRELAKATGLVDPHVSTQAVFSHFGVTSFANAVAAQEIDQFHRETLGILTVGSITSPLQRANDGGYRQSYTFGSIVKPAGTFPDVGKRFHVTVSLAGIRCFGTDDPSGTDEPYVITSVFTLDPREKDKASQTKLISQGTIGDVQVGDIFAQNIDLATDFAVPGDGDIKVNVQLFDEEAVSNEQKAAKAISDGNTAAMLAGVAVLTAFIPPAGAAAAAGLAVLKAAGLLDAFSDGIGSIIASLFSGDHLGTVDLRITHQFLETLRDNPKSLDRTSAAIGGETYNFPQLPEDNSEEGTSWRFDAEGKGTYRPFFRVVLTEA